MSDQIEIDGFTFVTGMHFRIKRLSGVWTFQYATESASGAVSLTFTGGPKGHFRSFRPEQVVMPRRKRVKSHAA
jgi:hypothetical protein